MRSSAFNSSTKRWVFRLLHRDKPHSAYSPEDQRFHSAVIDVDGCSPCCGSTTSVGNGPGSAEDGLEVQQEQYSHVLSPPRLLSSESPSARGAEENRGLRAEENRGLGAARWPTAEENRGLISAARWPTAEASEIRDILVI